MSPRNLALKRSAVLWRLVYIGWDFAGGVLAYTLLYFMRKSILEPARFGLTSMHWDSFYGYGAALTGILWVASYGMVGLYAHPIRKSRLKEMSQVLQTWLLFSTAYFILFILDDYVKDFTGYFKSAGIFTGTLLLWTTIGRLFFGYLIRHSIQIGKYRFPTLLIGSRDSLTPYLESLKYHASKSGEHFIGWVDISGNTKNDSLDGIPIVGTTSCLPQLIKDLYIEDCILALPQEEHHKLTPLVLDLELLGTRIFMVPDTFGILSGMVGIDEHGVPLLEWHIKPLTPWQRNTKRLTDLIVSFLALILLLPLLIVLAILLKIQGGPAFYWQERLGRRAKPFKMLKLRTMRPQAEKEGPQLSSEDDPRITPLGKVLRKYRLDELPQFWNVFVGEMSLVGPRPERDFFAAQILQKAPQYRHIYKVQPGITSWGMVRFGYASNVEQMIRRMEYDLIYIENMSFFNDIKVVIYTIWTVIQGRGK